MAFASTIVNADANLQSLLTVLERISFSDLPGTPTSNVNWLSGLTLPNIKFQTAATTPDQTNPIEVASTAVWGDLITAAGTSHTIDLAALPRSTELGNLDLTGLKVQGFMFACPYTNTDDVVVDVGASNGYNLFDQSAAKVAVAPGGIVFAAYPENTAASVQMPDVGASAKEIDLSSAMSNFVIQAAFFAG